MFKVSESYTRNEIHDQVGGSKQSYLSFDKQNRIDQPDCRINR